MIVLPIVKHEDSIRMCYIERKRISMILIVNELIRSVPKDQQTFWITMHKVSSRKSQPRNNITTEDWFIHFKSVLAKEIDGNEEYIVQDDEDSFFNRPITREEVVLAINKLKCRKSAGPDGFIGETVKCAGDSVVDFLVNLFNVLFNDGIFPDG